jgi:TatD DNase family protein
MEIIDTHCHLYLADFAEEIDEILQRADIEGVTRFFSRLLTAKLQNSSFPLKNGFLDDVLP